MSQRIKTIAVDLTPVLPGGENGGAKIFVLDLLQRLAGMMPDTKFILLTHSLSHQELSGMDRLNMRRHMVIGSEINHSCLSGLSGCVSRIYSYFPDRLNSIASRGINKIKMALKWGSTGSLLRNMGVDLLFCPFTAPTYCEPDIPVVCTIYDLQYKTYPCFFNHKDVEQRDKSFHDACHHATALVAISDYSRNSAIRHGNLSSERIRTIYLQMAQRIVPGDLHDKYIVGRLGLLAQRYLIYPANFWKHKNHEMLLTAFNMACHEGLATDVKLVCTGSPGLRQDWLAKAVRRMDLGNRVFFPGYLPNSELAALLADCAGVIFPSLYEGFGLPVLEAMAVGVPVACSNATSLPEVVADAAVLFDPRIPKQIAQAIRTLVEDKEQCIRLVQAGNQRVSAFSNADQMAREYWELFQYAFAGAKADAGRTWLSQEKAVL